MTDKNMKALSDDDFERTLTESVSKIPPADISFKFISIYAYEYNLVYKTKFCQMPNTAARF